jgi:hypothetical protein
MNLVDAEMVQEATRVFRITLPHVDAVVLGFTRKCLTWRWGGRYAAPALIPAQDFESPPKIRNHWPVEFLVQRGAMQETDDLLSSLPRISEIVEYVVDQHPIIGLHCRHHFNSS